MGSYVQRVTYIERANSSLQKSDGSGYVHMDRELVLRHDDSSSICRFISTPFHLRCPSSMSASWIGWWNECSNSSSCSNRLLIRERVKYFQIPPFVVALVSWQGIAPKGHCSSPWTAVPRRRDGGSTRVQRRWVFKQKNNCSLSTSIDREWDIEHTEELHWYIKAQWASLEMKQEHLVLMLVSKSDSVVAKEWIKLIELESLGRGIDDDTSSRLNCELIAMDIVMEQEIERQEDCCSVLYIQFVFGLLLRNWPSLYGSEWPRSIRNCPFAIRWQRQMLFINWPRDFDVKI